MSRKRKKQIDAEIERLGVAARATENVEQLEAIERDLCRLLAEVKRAQVENLRHGRLEICATKKEVK